MSTSPIVSNATHSPDLAFGPDHPQYDSIDQQQLNLDIPDDYKNLMVTTIKEYRGQWAPDRLMRVARWMKNVLMYRGQQIIAWDPGSNTYFDALAYWRREGSPRTDGSEDGLEKYINNITQMLGDSFIGTMSRGIPPTIIQPENAEVLADVTTAKAAQQAISIIERVNRIHQMVRIENSLLYLYGCYFKHTRGVLDGEWAGWDYEEILGPITVTKPDRYRCFNCGKSTPANQLQPQDDDTDRQCPGCGTALGDESFYESEQSQEQGVVGTQKVPKAMVKWDVYGPLEFDADPQAKKLTDSPMCSLDLDIDVGVLRMIFPTVAEKILPGQEIDTTPNASYEKLRRAEVNSQTDNYTPENQNFTSTYSRNWLQPTSYWKMGDKSFAKFMQDKFPAGCRVSMVGTEIVDIREASMGKEWTCCLLRENVGLFPPSIADNVVPFNERLNDTMNIIDDWMVRCAAGMTIYDKSKIDSREMKGQKLTPGRLFGLQTKAQGMTMALRDAIVQFEFTLEPKIFEYPGQLIQQCELIAGVAPQTFGGGTQEDVETAKGQAQQLDTALTKYNIYWENEKEEHAAASQNAIECLQKLMKAGAVGEIYEVIQANGSEFRNNYVNLNKMKGRVKVSADTDEGLPQSPMQIRQTIENLLEEAGKGNQIALALLDVVPNQEMFMSVMAPPGTVIPSAAQRSLTLQDINTLMESDWITVPNPADPTRRSMIQQLPVMPEWYTEFPIARATISQYCRENCDYRKSNPEGWKRLKAYNDLLEKMDMQIAVAEAQRTLQVKQAGAPPPPKANPQQQSALALITADAADEVTNLQQISHLSSTATKGSVTGQVQAAGKILDAALKSAKLASEQ